MKAIFVVANMGGGGSERVIANLATDFIKKNMEVMILMTSANDIAYELHEKIELICIGDQTNGSIIKRIERIIKMRRVFKENREAHIISFGTETNMFTILASQFLPNRVIISERNDPNKCTYKKLRNIIYAKADIVVFQTEDAKNYFKKKIRNKGVIISNPISENLIDTYKGMREKKIVAVGRLTKQKNQELLLRAFKIFYSTHKDFRLTIFGKGELEEELKQYVEKMKMENQVSFEGFQQDILEKIKKASMYVLSSDYEGVSNSLMEAMAIGLPVISTDCPIGGSKMLIKNGVNGILVPMNEPQELANAMKLLADNDELAKEISQQGSLIRKQFCLSKISDLWIKLLEV